jgi:hypothetical protein
MSCCQFRYLHSSHKVNCPFTWHHSKIHILCWWHISGSDKNNFCGIKWLDCVAPLRYSVVPSSADLLLMQRSTWILYPPPSPVVRGQCEFDVKSWGAKYFFTVDFLANPLKLCDVNSSNTWVQICRIHVELSIVSASNIKRTKCSTKCRDKARENPA